MSILNRRIVLAQRPTGMIAPDDLRYEEVDKGSLSGEGMVRVENHFISLDPATRGWMDDKESYMEPIAEGDVIRSGAIGEVTESHSKRYQPGDLVLGLFGWEEVSDVHEKQVGRKATRRDGIPLSYELSVLGGNGLTAYFGLHKIGEPKEGEAVVVSAAAGGVGSIAGQLARLEGCRAVGIVGSEEKCRFIVDELGYDAAINRKSGDLAQQIRSACPDGVDVYFDNVGGEVLNTTLRHINIGARIVLCGAISQINEKTLPPGPSNYVQLLAKRAKMEGFVTLDFARQWQAASEELAGLVTDGSLVVPEEIVEGIERIPEAFQRLFTGEKLGKLTIKV